MSKLGLAVNDKSQQKPKKLYVPPGGRNTFFHQMMREEMSKTAEKGPRKLDKDAYAELQDQAKQNHLSTLEQVDSHSPSSAWRKKDQED